MELNRKDRAQPEFHISYCQEPGCKMRAVVEVALTNTTPSVPLSGWVALCAKHRPTFDRAKAYAPRRREWVTAARLGGGRRYYR